MGVPLALSSIVGDVSHIPVHPFELIYSLGACLIHFYEFGYQIGLSV